MLSPSRTHNARPDVNYGVSCPINDMFLLFDFDFKSGMYESAPGGLVDNFLVDLFLLLFILKRFTMKTCKNRLNWS